MSSIDRTMTEAGAIGKRFRAVLPAVMLLFGVAVTSLPLVAFPYVPTQDGGGHYNTAMVLAGFESHARVFFEHYFKFRSIPLTNQFASYTMAWVADLGFVANADRIVWLMIFAAFSAVVVGNLWLLRRDAIVFALLFFPVFAGSPVNLGFMNFLAGMVLFTQTAFVLQFGLQRPTILWLCGLLMLAVVTYLAHPLAALMLGACAGSFAAGYLALWGLAAWPHVRHIVRVDASFSKIVPLGCALVCLIVAAMAANDAFPQIVRFFAATRRGLSTSPTSSSLQSSSLGIGLYQRLIDVFGLSYFVSYSPADYLFSAAFALVAGWLAWCRLHDFWRNRVLRAGDAWLATMVMLLLFSIIAPRRFETYLPERITACLLSVGALWLATSRLDRAAYRRLFVTGLALNAGFLLWRLDWSAGVNRVLAEYASVAPMLSENATLLTIRSSPSYHQAYCRAMRPRDLPCRFEPTRHFMGNTISGRDIALLSNYQLRPQSGFFPITLREPWSEYVRYIDQFEHWPPPAELRPEIESSVADLLERHPVDIIVTWDERLATGAPQGLFPAAVQPILRHYTKVFTSSPLGTASVYVRNTQAARP